MEFFVCSDNNPKVIQIEFDTGTLQKKDLWKICKQCNLKPEFKEFRIRIQELENCDN